MTVHISSKDVAIGMAGSVAHRETEQTQDAVEQEVSSVVNTTEVSAQSLLVPKWPRRVAVVHEWLNGYGGSERVLEQILAVFPDADLFTLFDLLPEGHRFVKKPVQTSFLQNLPWVRTGYRAYLPLMPLAIEQFDLQVYDLVISSSHAVAKGVITGPDQLHVCMCYSPMRYAWDLQNVYLHEAGLNHGVRGILARWLLHKARMWDVRTANGVDEFIAISQFIARRIRKVYGRRATVLYPPVDTNLFSLECDKDDFYLAASRIVPYKKIGLIVEAFRQMPDKRLVVIGDGPQYQAICGCAPNNVALMGYQSSSVLREHMQRAQAFIFAAEEDFGIMCVEAQACGTPVIAFGKGGALETISGLDSMEPTGVFFKEQSVIAIQQAVREFECERRRIRAEACRKNALRFGIPRFRREFSDFIAQKWATFAQISNNQ